MSIYILIYLISIDKLKTLREYIDDNLIKGQIRESIFQVASPIIQVFKKDNTKRLIIDYRKLNIFIKKNRYPFLLAIELRDRLDRATIFIKMDLQNRYYLIRIKEDEEWKTVFKIKYRLYKYQVILFRLTNVLVTFIRFINNVLL